MTEEKRSILEDFISKNVTNSEEAFWFRDCVLKNGDLFNAVTEDTILEIFQLWQKDYF